MNLFIDLVLLETNKRNEVREVIGSYYWWTNIFNDLNLELYTSVCDWMNMIIYISSMANENCQNSKEHCWLLVFNIICFSPILPKQSYHFWLNVVGICLIAAKLLRIFLTILLFIYHKFLDNGFRSVLNH